MDRAARLAVRRDESRSKLEDVGTAFATGHRGSDRALHRLVAHKQRARQSGGFLEALCPKQGVDLDRINRINRIENSDLKNPVNPVEKI